MLPETTPPSTGTTLATVWAKVCFVTFTPTIRRTCFMGPYQVVFVNTVFAICFSTAGRATLAAKFVTAPDAAPTPIITPRSEARRPSVSSSMSSVSSRSDCQP